jgi:signal transduction histidine kinase/ABC-type multidrug transport system ATPase subunit
MTATLPHAEPQSPPLLTVGGLSANFGPVRALSDVDLRIARGELVALAGEPGAGKSTVVRCIAGDIAPAGGEIMLDNRPVPADPAGASRRGIAVVWQDLALCDNLDVAGNVLLGKETKRLMLSDSRFHAAAAALLQGVNIPIWDTTRLVGSLSGGQRQLVALARAVCTAPQLLVLDEPTASLGVIEAGQVEDLIVSLREQGTAVLLASRDIEQMFRLADRIVVLRHGRVVAEIDPRSTHPDDLTAIMSGQQVDSSARRQLTRLHGLADRLVSADPSSSLSLILSALGAALATERACIHVAGGTSLSCAASLGFAAGEITPWLRLPYGSAGGPVGRAAATEERVIEENLRVAGTWAPLRELVAGGTVASAWSVPVIGPSGVSAVITVFRSELGAPGRDELDLLTLYAGYAASAVERDRLLDQVTGRNRVLETIREMLETLAGPVPVSDALTIALQSLRRGLQADEVVLVTQPAAAEASWRGYAGPLGTHPGVASASLREAARHALTNGRPDGTAQQIGGDAHHSVLAVPFNAPGGATVLLAGWIDLLVTEEETALIENAAHSLRLALEREEAGLAHQEAAALRRSRELQRSFLSRLSHELRTPLTAIRGYASSLLAHDVTWDGDSEQRFLGRIAAESARLGRLVDDLLDFSAIESGVMRLQLDWCDIPLVVDAAVSCLPGDQSAQVSVACDPALPTVWADHDRLEQVFVNLLNNAFKHNPPGTHVWVSGRRHGAEVEISVVDDGAGFPPALAASPFDSARRHRTRTAGAGLGLSIARGIVDAHGGTISLAPAPDGTAFRISLPTEAVAHDEAHDHHDVSHHEELVPLTTRTRAGA